jgi:hypothetical protein
LIESELLEARFEKEWLEKGYIEARDVGHWWLVFLCIYAFVEKQYISKANWPIWVELRTPPILFVIGFAKTLKPRIQSARMVGAKWRPKEVE